MEWIVVRTFLSLAAVIGLMIVVVYVMKKYVYGAKLSSGNLVDITIIGTRMLQPKRSVSVLKVMNKVLIIGVSEDGMQTLGEISDEKSMLEVNEKLASQETQPKWFSKKVAKRESSSSVSFAEALSIQIHKLVAKGS